MKNSAMIVLVLLICSCRDASDINDKPKAQKADVVVGKPQSEVRKPSQLEITLGECVGLTVKEIENKAKLSLCKKSSIEEPPSILRGVVYYTGTEDVYLYIHHDDPMYRNHEMDEWTDEALSKCVISGIQIWSVDGQGGLFKKNIGFGIPFQFE
jgi:hypothetical protein